MKLKQILSCFLLLFILCGCYEDESSPTPTELPSTPTPQPPPIVDENDPDDAQNSPPTHAALAVSFTGSASPGHPQNFLRGEIHITKAEDESLIEKYHIYWIDNSSNRVLQTPFVTLNRTENNLQHEISNDIDIPIGATRFLVVTANNFGEMASGVSIRFACDNLDFKAPDCESCVNTKHTGASCDQCASPYTNFPTCDTCLDEKHTGQNCDKCKPQFKASSFPACDECANTFLGPNCASCIFPLADYSTLCTVCTEPLRTPPRCLR